MANKIIFDFVGDDKQLKATFAGVENEAKKASQSTENAFKGVGNGLNNEFKSIGSSISSTFDGVSNNIKKTFSDIGTSLKGSFDLSSILNFSVAGLATQGITQAVSVVSGAFSEAFDKGNEFNTALKNLQATTGATADQMLVLEQSAKQAFLGGVGESVAEATNIIAKAQISLGGVFDADELTEFTTKANALGNLFDKDVNEVLQKSAPFIKQFGLDGEEAFNLIALAQQQGGTASDDILDSLAEYSQLASKAGFSAEQFTSILVNGAKEGIFNTDKLADAIKEAEIRIKAGDFAKPFEDINNSANEAEKAFIKPIQSIIEAGQKGELTIQETLQKSTELIKKGFDDGSISESLASQLQVAIAGTPSEDIGTELFNKIFSAPIDEATIQANAQKAGESISNAVGQYAKFDELKRNFVLLYTEIGAGAVQFLDGTFNTIGEVFSRILSGIQSGLQPLIDAFAILGNELSKLFGSTGEGIDLFEIFKGVLFTIADIIGGVLTIAIRAITFTLTKLVEFIGFLVNQFSKFIDLLKQTAVFKAFTQFIESVYNSFLDVVGVIGSTIKSVLEFLGLLGSKPKTDTFKEVSKETAKTSKNIENANKLTEKQIDLTKDLAKQDANRAGELNKINEAYKKQLEQARQVAIALNLKIETEEDKQASENIKRQIENIKNDVETIETIEVELGLKLNLIDLESNRQIDKLKKDLENEKKLFEQSLKDSQFNANQKAKLKEQFDANVVLKETLLQSQINEINAKANQEREKAENEAINRQIALTDKQGEKRKKQIEDQAKLTQKLLQENFGNEAKLIEQNLIKQKEIREKLAVGVTNEADKLSLEKDLNNLIQEQVGLQQLLAIPIQDRIKYQNELIALQKEYNENLKLAGDNEKLRADAFQLFQDKVSNLKFPKATDSGLESVNDLLKSLQKEYGNLGKEAEKNFNKINEATNNAKKNQGELNFQLQAGIIDYTEYASKTQQLEFEKNNAINESRNEASQQESLRNQKALADFVNLTAGISNGYSNINLALDTFFAKQKELQDASATTWQDYASVTADALGAASTAFGENTIAFKALAIAQATIATYLGANKALLLPFPSNILTSGLIILKGLANVAKIAGIGFKKGGYTGEKGTSDVAGVVHGKEFVVNAKATKENRELLEYLNKYNRLPETALNFKLIKDSKFERIGMSTNKPKQKTEIYQEHLITTSPTKTRISGNDLLFLQKGAKVKQIQRF